MKKHYAMQGRIEQLGAATFKAIVCARSMDRASDESESIESYAATHEEALRLLVGLAATLSAAIRMRGDSVGGLQIEGEAAHKAASD